MGNRLEENKVAFRYSRALFEAASEQDEADAVFSQLQELKAVFESVPELSRFLENPAIPDEDKQRFVDQDLKSLSPWVSRLFKLLIENKRTAVFSALVDNYQTLLYKRDNTAQAEVVTAIELDKAAVEKVRKQLEAQFSYDRVEVQNRVEPGILGGAIIRIADQVIDGSYVGRLEDLRKQLVERV